MKVYYDRRAPEYDDWWLGLGRFDGLPFDDASFDRVFTGHFYGHLDATNVCTFSPKRDAWPPSSSSSMRPSGLTAPARESRSILNDGSKWTVYKRYFTGPELAAELGGGEVLHESRWFVVVRG